MQRHPHDATRPRRWHWQGHDAEGRRRHGEVIARGEAAARLTLRQQHPQLTITSLGPGRRHAAAARTRSKDATDLVRRLATLLAAGVTLTAALDVLARGAHTRGLKRLAAGIAQDIALGHPFAQAMAHASRRFSSVDCQLIAAGELSGRLGPTLVRLSAHYDHIQAVRDKLQRALAYPLTVLAVAVAVVIALLQWVIPEFERLFASAAGGAYRFRRSLVRSSICLERRWQTALGYWHVRAQRD